MDRMQLGRAVQAALDLVHEIDGYIEKTEPFRLAKVESNLPRVGTILYNCTEALRLASLLLWPVIPDKMESLWKRIGCHYLKMIHSAEDCVLKEWLQWGQCKPGTSVIKGESLFPRVNPE